MAITLRSVSTPANASGPLTVTKPTGATTGDLMILSCVTGGATANHIMPPDGWQLIPKSEYSTALNLLLFYKYVGASEPANYSVATLIGGSTVLGVGIACFYDSGAGVVTIGDVQQQVNASSTNRVFPSVTPATAADMLCCFAHLGTSNASTPDAACAEQWDFGANERQYFMNQTLASSSATGTRTATGAGAVTSICVSLILTVATHVAPAGPFLRFISATESAGSHTSSHTIAAPDRLQVGDLMILHMRFATNGVRGTPPNGWTAVPSGYIAGTNSLDLYYKIAQAGDIGASVTVTFSGTQTMSMGLDVYYSPRFKVLYIDATAQADNTTATSHAYPAVTTTKPEAILGLFQSLGTTSTNTSTPPATAFKTQDTSNTAPRVTSLWRRVYSAGATGTTTITLGTTSTARLVTVAIAERDYPGDPTGLTAAAISDDQIDLSWSDAATNETGYKVERSADGSTGWTEIADIAANSVSYSDTGLAEYTTYYYRVFAYNTDGPSGYSNTANATTEISAPTGLAATAASDEQIDLVWVDNSGAESGYKIERSNNGVSGWTVIHTTAADEESYSDTGLADNVTRYYRARAYNGSDFSDYSNTDSDTTWPAAASSLVATALSGTRIDLTWSDDSTGEDGFSIERKTGIGGTYAEITTVAANAEAYSDTTVAENTTYYYRIRAFVGAVYSGYSNVASETTPADFSAPADVTATALGPRRIRIEWTDPNTNELGYLIERSFFADDGFIQIASVAANVEQYTDTGLEPESTYYYRVRGYK